MWDGNYGKDSLSYCRFPKIQKKSFRKNYSEIYTTDYSFGKTSERLVLQPLDNLKSREDHRRLCRVKNMLAIYLKYHKAGLTPTTPVTSIAISPVKMSIGHKSLTNLHSEMIFLQGKPIFYIFLPSTPPYWQIILRFCWQWTPKWQQSESRSCATYFRLSVVLGFYHIYY